MIHVLKRSFPEKRLIVAGGLKWDEGGHAVLFCSSAGAGSSPPSWLIFVEGTGKTKKWPLSKFCCVHPEAKILDGTGTMLHKTKRIRIYESQVTLVVLYVVVISYDIVGGENKPFEATTHSKSNLPGPPSGRDRHCLASNFCCRSTCRVGR